MKFLWSAQSSLHRAAAGSPGASATWTIEIVACQLSHYKESREAGGCCWGHREAESCFVPS